MYSMYASKEHVYKLQGSCKIIIRNMYDRYKEHNYYIVTVDYNSNWKKVEREVGRVRGMEGVREDMPIT